MNTVGNLPVVNFDSVNSLSSKVEVTVACRNLLNKDVTSKSDPMCVLFLSEFGKSNYKEFGRTEVVKDNLNPDFIHKFIVDYRFEELQKLKFAVYDADSLSSDLRQHDYLGEYETTLGELVSLRSVTKPIRANNSQSCGTIIIRAEEMVVCNEVLNLKLSGHKLDKKDFLGKSDPYLVFYKSNEDLSFTVVFKTEIIKNTLNPVWKEFSLPMSALCNGDTGRTIRVECYDWDSYGEHDLIGCFLTNASQLSSTGGTFDLVNPKKKASSKSYKSSGTIRVDSARVTKNYGFLDYIQAGVTMNFTVAIDFTQSNGNPKDRNSLHFIDDTALNQYATALMAVGNIIQDYDSDKMFPALGFGAKMPNGSVSHEFFMNGHPTNPFCAGIGGIMQAYQTAIRTVELWGPTNFSPVINHVSRFASAVRDGSNYFVLLILTDGIITDMTLTMEAIINASMLPMSIIIVGVGNADFSAMDTLDGDGRLLTVNGKLAERDIVQFVPLRDYLSCGNSTMVQARLAKDVLAEIPTQFLTYMRKHNINPPQKNSQ